MRTTFYQGTPTGQSFNAPAIVGLRPGYIYRIKCFGFAARPDLAIYPTLEVRGSLNLTARINPASFPAPVVLTDADLQSRRVGIANNESCIPRKPGKGGARTGGARPDDGNRTHAGSRLAQRSPRCRPTGAGGALRQPHPTACGTRLWQRSRHHPVPRRKDAAAAARSSVSAVVGCGFYDPILGPRPPEEECFHDGGDRGPRAGIGPDGQLHGLDPEDTIGEYTDAAGRRRVVPSNRICLCSPRFAVLEAICH